MSLDVLITALTRAAEQEAEQIRTAAVERARVIVHSAEEHARQRRDTEHARLEAAHRQAVARDTATAVRENRQALLEARARVLDQVFARAATILSGADSTLYQEGIPALVRATTRYLEGTPAELRCRPDILSVVRSQCNGTPHLGVLADADVPAGLLGQSGDGRVVVDNTLPALLARRRADLEVAVAGRLEEA